MDLSTARQHIEACLVRMQAAYGQPLFDEWAILSSSAQPGILAYSGPRAHRFGRDVADDAEPLIGIVAGREFHPGDFDFATDAAGTLFDACLMLGPSTYLVCNHTSRALAELRRDPKWLKAQPIFFSLSEKFRADPLLV